MRLPADLIRSSFIHGVGIDLKGESGVFLRNGAMQSAIMGLPIYQLLRNACLGRDPGSLPASTADQHRPANGIQETGGALLQAVSGPDGVPGFRSSTGASDRPELDKNARPPSISLERRGAIARAAILFYFMSIVFLTGIFIGASLIPALPGRPPPTNISISVPAPPQIETPTPGRATTGSDSASEAAIPRAGVADVTPVESRPPQLTSVDAHPTAALVPIEPVPAHPPQSEPPGVTADAPPAPAEPAGGPLIPEETPVPARLPTPTPAQPPTADAGGPRLSSLEIHALLSRGDTFLATGDVTSARLFYKRGADAGDGTAALRLGETFDAAFLERARLGRVPSDLGKAVSWYGRARDLGNAEAEILLKSLHGQ